MSEIRLKFSRFLHSVSTYANGRSQARFQRFTSSLHQKTEMIIDIIRVYSYCHEQNHPRFRLTVKSSLVSSCEDVLHFLLSFGHLAKIRSVVWPRFVRSFGQDPFGRLTKFHSVVWPNQHVTSVVLPNPSLQIGFRCLYNKVYVTPASR